MRRRISGASGYAERSMCVVAADKEDSGFHKSRHHAAAQSWVLL